MGKTSAILPLFDIPVARLDGSATSLAQYRGQVLLIVNTASNCGFTPQYQGLEKLHRKYAGQGLAVLGFPCNQFGDQEPGSAAEIAAFCSREFKVDFPLFEKVEVNGPEAHPIYELLKAAAPGFLGTDIKWNFTKFLVDRSGLAVRRFAPATPPEHLDKEIQALLSPVSN
jgi:glutathione peroxidase